MASLANINKVNKSASTHSIVIGDRDYNDGFTWIETVRFMFEYAFETLKLNRLYGVSLVGHPMSNIIGDLMFMARKEYLDRRYLKMEDFMISCIMQSLEMNIIYIKKMEIMR